MSAQFLMRPRNSVTGEVAVSASSLARRWLGLADADITINAADGTFEARLLIAAPASSGVPPAGFSGRWLVRDGLLLTAITVLA